MGLGWLAGVQVGLWCVGGWFGVGLGWFAVALGWVRIGLGWVQVEFGLVGLVELRIKASLVRFRVFRVWV